MKDGVALIKLPTLLTQTKLIHCLVIGMYPRYFGIIIGDTAKN